MLYLVTLFGGLKSKAWATSEPVDHLHEAADSPPEMVGDRPFVVLGSIILDAILLPRASSA